MKNGIKNLAGTLVAILLFTVLLNAVFNNAETKMSYSELMVAIQNGTIESVEIEHNRSGFFSSQQINGKAYVILKDSNQLEKQVDIPSIESFLNATNQYVLDGSLELVQRQESIIITVVSLALPIVILVIFFAFLLVGRASSRRRSKKFNVFWKK